MKISYYSFLLIVTILFIPTLANAQFVGGSGTIGDPYQISNVIELQNINMFKSANYIVISDIDATITTTWNLGLGFIPLGTNSLDTFSGTFDGQDHTIMNLYINNTTSYNGLFGYTSNAEISNIILENVNITGANYIGSLVGFSSSTTINNSYSTGNVVSTTGPAGGFIGLYEEGVNIENCYSQVNTTSSTGTCGGFIGYVGAYSGSTTTITNCYSTGSISGNSNIGGFIGESVTVTFGIIDITSCYWDIDTSGQATSNGGSGKTTAEMQTQDTYTDWDFTTPVWNMNPLMNGGYPFLEMEGDTPPEVPENLITEIIGTDLKLSWDSAPGAATYIVYSSNNPYSVFSVAAVVLTNTWSVDISEAKKFYYITSHGGF